MTIEYEISYRYFMFFCAFVLLIAGETAQADPPEATLIRLGGQTVSVDSNREKQEIKAVPSMNLSLQDADIHHAIRLIAETAELNIVIADGVSGKVTVELKDVPWTDALTAILMSKGLVAVNIGEIVHVQPLTP
jgi:type IV pilus assembly protein PilQ